jgi:predicted HAD superfamily hydrolase
MDDNTKDKVVRKQMKIVDFFRKISNKFAIQLKQGENETAREINSEKKKYNIDEVMDEMPDSATPMPNSSIF